MTRVTNFGLKRTYLEAGFVEPEPPRKASAETSQPATGDLDEPQDNKESNGPTKKKRKRNRAKKPNPNAVKDAHVESGEPRDDGGALLIEEDKEGGPSTSKPIKAKKNKKSKEKSGKHVSLAEKRRLKRIEEKLAVTTCFACREKGHAAKDCPTTLEGSRGVNEKGKAESIVGICYRCGSTRHNLARCKKPSDPGNPLPYASCFVCSGKGHLASSCPQNKAKGVYPNGGCCKICGDTSHLARDCDMRRGDVLAKVAVGTGQDAGADEDDFHILNRRTKEVERTEKKEDKMKRLFDPKESSRTGVPLVSLVKKKVIVF